MRLILSNFRCFSSLDITLPDSGTCIIWGNSGIGKSSIFKAINFALYGKEQKVVKNGEKKCKEQCEGCKEYERMLNDEVKRLDQLYEDISTQIN